MAMTSSCTASGVRKRHNTEHIAKLTHVHVEWEQATDGSNTEAVGLGHLTRVDHHAALGEVGVHGCVRGYNGKSEHRGQGTRSASDILGRSKLGSSAVLCGLSLLRPRARISMESPMVVSISCNIASFRHISIGISFNEVTAGQANNEYSGIIKYLQNLS